MDPEQLMESLSLELQATLDRMAATTDLQEKQVYSEIARNLTGSLGVFLQFASDMAGLDFDEFDDDF